MIRRKVSLVVMSLLPVVVCSMTVMAGSINKSEERVIDAAGGTFVYQERSYTAKSQYLERLETKLSEDGTDLTSEQADEMIRQMYANIGNGVSLGYLKEVEKNQSDPPTAEGSGENNGEDMEESVAENGQGGWMEFETETVGMVKENTNASVDIQTEMMKDSNKEERRNKQTTEETNHIVPEENESSENVFDAKDDLILGYTGESESETTEALTVQNMKIDLSNLLKEKSGILVIGMLILMVSGILAVAAKKVWKSAMSSKLVIQDYIDIHSHILPGVDDGAESEAETMQMVQMAYEQGIRKMIATPHYRSGHRHKTSEELYIIYENTKKMIQDRYSDFELYLGNEVFCSDGLIDKLEQKKVYTLAGSRYILLEFRTDESFKKIRQTVTDLVREGYISVIAHAERYKSLVGSRENLDEIKKAGALLQMNLCVSRRYSKLIKEGYIDILATDCHGSKERTPEIKKELKKLCTICQQKELDRMLKINPSKILEDKYI